MNINNSKIFKDGVFQGVVFAFCDRNRIPYLIEYRQFPDYIYLILTAKHFQDGKYRVFKSKTRNLSEISKVLDEILNKGNIPYVLIVARDEELIEYCLSDIVPFEKETRGIFTGTYRDLKTFSREVLEKFAELYRSTMNYYNQLYNLFKRNPNQSVFDCIANCTLMSKDCILSDTFIEIFRYRQAEINNYFK
jgi:hypothetical protein